MKEAEDQRRQVGCVSKLVIWGDPVLFISISWTNCGSSDDWKRPQGFLGKQYLKKTLVWILQCDYRELNEIRRFKSRIWNVRLRGSKVSEVKSLQREGGAIWKGILLHVLYECVQVGKWPNVLQWCTLFNPKNREGNDGHLKHSSVASSHNIWRHDIMEARFGKTEQRWCKIQFILHCTKLNSLSYQIRAGC